MPNDEETLPPRQPNTPRVWLPRIGAWLAENKGFTIPVGCFLLGAVMGALVF